jgi:hypothetical protein
MGFGISVGTIEKEPLNRCRLPRPVPLVGGMSHFRSEKIHPFFPQVITGKKLAKMSHTPHLRQETGHNQLNSVELIGLF